MEQSDEQAARPGQDGDRPPTRLRNPIALAGLIVAIIAFALAAHARAGLIGGVIAMVLGAVGLARAVRTDSGVALALFAMAIGLVAAAYSVLASY